MAAIRTWFRPARKLKVEDPESGSAMRRSPSLTFTASDPSVFNHIWPFSQYSGSTLPAGAQPQAPKPPDVPAFERRNKWTMIHSFYAIMGGFAFDARLLGRDMLPHGRQRVTLTADGVVELASVAPHLLPDLTAAHIKDKSKANKLAKTIVVLQASWFVAQCITRLALGMMISLLELNTFAHALCALIAYALWWHKPFDVEEPTLIEGSDADLLCAGLCMRSDLGLQFLQHDFAIDGRTAYCTVTPEGLGHGQPGKMSVISPGITGFMRGTQPRNAMASLEANVADHVEKEAMATTHPLYMGQSLHGFAFPSHRFERPKRTIFNVFSPKPCIQPVALHRPFIELSFGDMLRFRLAQRCYAKYTVLSLITSASSDPSSIDWRRSFIVGRSRNWPVPPQQSIRMIAKRSGIFGLLLAGLAYGGLHLMAWNPPVRTAAEVIIWRVASMGVIVCGALPTAIAAAVTAYYVCEARYRAYADHHEAWLWRKKRESKKKKWRRAKRLSRLDSLSHTIVGGGFLALVVIGVGVTVGAVILYVVARVYLVVECFVSIPRLPIAVFETPKWSEYLPHLG